MEQYKIKNILGKGLNGIVFLVEDDQKQQYALKVEQIMFNELNQADSLYKREIEFSDYFSTKYPNQFMKILIYQNKKCGYKHQLTPERWKLMSKKMYEYYQKLFKSDYCSIKLTNKVDTTVYDMMFDISNKKIVYEILIQIVYIAYLIQSNGFYHRDFKPKNIGVVYTNDNYITILNKQIPTNGIMLQAIDYGNVIHKIHKYENDLYVQFDKFILRLMLKHIIEKYPDIDITLDIPIDKKYKDKLKKIIDIKYNYKYFEQILYKIIYFDEYKKQLGIDSRIPLFDFISITNLKYLIKHYNDLHKVLVYLIKHY